MAVRPEVMTLLMVKRGAKAVTSQFSPESAVLERGEERVEFGQRGAVGGFQFVDGDSQSGKTILVALGRQNDRHLLNVAKIDPPHSHALRVSCHPSLKSLRPKAFAHKDR